MATQKTPTKSAAPAPAVVANGAAAKATRAKKEDAAIFVEFVNSKNETLKRIPEDVHSIKVIDKSKNAVAFNVKDITLPVLVQLASDSLRRRFKLLKEGGDKPVLAQAQSIFDLVKSGKLYSSEPGAARPGRTFDTDLWVDAVSRAMIYAEKAGNGKKLTDKQVADLRTRLTAATPAERKGITIKWSANALIKRSLLEIKAEQAQAKVSDGGNLADLLTF